METLLETDTGHKLKVNDSGALKLKTTNFSKTNLINSYQESDSLFVCNMKKRVSFSQVGLRIHRTQMSMRHKDWFSYSIPRTHL